MPYSVSPHVSDVLETLMNNDKIKKAMEFLKADQPNRTRENKEIALIQGETGKEAMGRSPYFKEHLERYGAKNCVIDGIGNTFGILPGTAPGKKPTVIFESHLDTVFLEDTPLAITEKDGRIYCPGIGDNASSMAQTLSILRAIEHAGLVPVGTLMPMGAAREEGHGNFDGMRFFLKDRNDIDAVVIVDGGGTERLGWGGIGIKRYEFIFHGPEGHSWHIAGAPSSLHAMCRAMAKVADIPMIDSPRTTINVGLVSGGTTVGAVAGETRVQVDMRSASAVCLSELEAKVLAAVAAGVAEENEFKKNQPHKITVEQRCFGDMPAGEGIADHPCVQVAYLATQKLGKTPIMDGGTCTNGNISVDKGIPTIIMGHGGFNGANHSLNEWYEPLDNYIAAQRVLLTIFALAGLDGVTRPLAAPLR